MASFVSVILLAGGRGTRFASSTPKQFLPLKGKPLILHSFDLFATLKSVQEIIIVTPLEYQSLFPVLPDKKVLFALPGEERQDSVANGLQSVNPLCEFLCIHDGARPLVSLVDVEHVLKEGITHGAATLAVPVKNTLKRVDAALFVQETLDRNSLWDIQTPQVIRADWLRRGLKLVKQNKEILTDDVGLVEKLGKPVKIVKGSYRNIKITTPEDLRIAEVL